MKVLILTPAYPHKKATMNGIFIHQQVKALQQLGVECHVLMMHTWFPPLGLHKHHSYWRRGFNEKQTHFEEYEGIKIHSVPTFIKMPTRLFKENQYDRAITALAKYIKKTKDIKDADWIYAHFLTGMGYIAAKLKKELNIKVAAITRGDDVHAWPEGDPTLIDNIRYVFAHADKLLANNKRLVQDALKFADTVRPDFGVVYNGINYHDLKGQKTTEQIIAIRNKYGIPTNKKVLLCVGRGEYLKGWQELLEAIAENKQLLADWILVAITNKGEGTYAIDIDKVVDELQIGERVLQKNFMPFDEVIELYKAVDAFILPSYNEGISNAVLEAMASGLWVITTDVGGHSEIMEDGVSGFLIAPKSKKAVADSLKYLVENYDARKEQVAIEAQNAMQRLGDYDQNAQKLKDYLTSI